MISLFFFWGCQQPQNELTYEPASTPDCTDETNLNLQSAVYIPTFYRDVLPILDSRKTGEVYKCTTCHVHYRQPEGSNSVAKVEEIIASVGPLGNMPTSGDTVKDSDVKMINKWRNKGFKTGKIEQFVARIDPPSSSGSNISEVEERNFHCDPVE